jgi:stage II sporulation protein AA (anti-sigma F factor antagonist)
MIKLIGQGGINMSIKLSVKGEVVTAYLGGELDHHSAREMREAIDNAIEMNIPSLLVLDFSGVTFMDSSGIGLVMGRYRNLIKSGAELHITGAPPQIHKMLKLAGIEKLAKLEGR